MVLIKDYQDRKYWFYINKINISKWKSVFKEFLFFIENVRPCEPARAKLILKNNYFATFTHVAIKEIFKEIDVQIY